MAKNITLLGASYSDVPAVNLPQTGGGTARFTDTSPTTATDSDVASGKIYIKADGTQSTGTASGGGGGGGIEITQDAQGYIVLPKTGGGGGGGSSYELIVSDEVTVSTSSTSQTLVKNIYTSGNAAYRSDVIIYVRIRDKAGKRTGYFYGSDCFFLNPDPAQGTQGGQTIAGRLITRCNDSGNMVEFLCTGMNGYGVYTREVNQNFVVIYSRYDSSYTLTIDGTYTVEVYALHWPDNVSPFIWT